MLPKFEIWDHLHNFWTDKATHCKYKNNTPRERFCRLMKIWPPKGRGLCYVTNFEILGPTISSELLKRDFMFGERIGWNRY